jgi:hypothetical protein
MSSLALDNPSATQQTSSSLTALQLLKSRDEHDPVNTALHNQVIPYPNRTAIAPAKQTKVHASSVQVFTLHYTLAP